MNTESNPPSAEEQASLETPITTSTSRLVSFVVWAGICAAVIGLYFVTNDIRDQHAKGRALYMTANAQWEDLRAQGHAHQVLVDTYRGCRAKRDAGTVEECLLVAKQYADLAGLEGEAGAVLRDMIPAVRKIEDELTAQLQ